MNSIKNFFAQFGSAVLLVGICAYLILQLTLGIGEVVDVEHTTYITVQDTLRLDAYLFRDETPLFSGTSGTDCFLVGDGERVSKGTPVSITYVDETDASVQERITRINRMIRILEQSNLADGAQTTDLAVLDQRIETLTVELLREIAEGDLSKAARSEEALWIEMNRRQALLDSDRDYTTQINLLKQERADLERSLRGRSVKVNAPEAGYFFGAVDGYETVFTMDALENLTVDGFLRLASSSADSRVLNDACGKMVHSAAWYIAVATDKRTASAYKEGASYDVLFPYSGSLTLSMRLDRKIMQTDLDTVVLVFESKELPESFDYSRTQTVQLVTKTHAGIRVSTDALRILDGVTGCYVLDGTHVVFKKADILYRNEEFAVCNVPYNSVKENRDDKAFISDEYISLYDTVITAGEDLYVGKVLQ